MPVAGCRCRDDCLPVAPKILNVSQFRRLTVVCFAGSLLKETGMVNPLSGGATGALGVIFDTQESKRAGLVAPG